MREGACALSTSNIMDTVLGRTSKNVYHLPLGEKQSWNYWGGNGRIEICETFDNFHLLKYDVSLNESPVKVLCRDREIHWIILPQNFSVRTRLPSIKM